MENQTTITAWGDQVFGVTSDAKPVMLRMLCEVVEALVALGIDEETATARIQSEFARQRSKGAAEDHANLGSEFAGIAILLNRVASASAVDLQENVDREMAKNRTRTTFAKGDGSGHHVVAPVLQVSPPKPKTSFIQAGVEVHANGTVRVRGDGHVVFEAHADYVRVEMQVDPKSGTPSGVPASSKPTI